MGTSATTGNPVKKELLISVNPGSSSLKCSVYVLKERLRLVMKASITGAGSGRCRLKLEDRFNQQHIERTLQLETVQEIVLFMTRLLVAYCRGWKIAAIGHRIVHGGNNIANTEEINDFFLKKLESVKVLAPLHLPGALTTIAAFRAIFPRVLQVACFDTTFHKDMHFEARHYALPRYLWKSGLIRYGFHGLSCLSVLLQLKSTGMDIRKYKIIIAHLGSGSSVTAVQYGKSADTTMGFTPAGGLIMNTRCGDIDPGVAVYLLAQKKLTGKGLDLLLNKAAGLKALSESDSSISALLEREGSDQRAAEAISMYCYQVRKQIGAMAAVLSGVDLLVFTGGIGEHVPEVRERICEGLQFLGIQVDQERNNSPATGLCRISARTGVYVVPADEEWIIARQISDHLAKQRTLKRS